MYLMAEAVSNMLQFKAEYRRFATATAIFATNNFRNQNAEKPA